MDNELAKCECCEAKRDDVERNEEFDLTICAHCLQELIYEWEWRRGQKADWINTEIRGMR